MPSELWRSADEVWVSCIALAGPRDGERAGRVQAVANPIRAVPCHCQEVLLPSSRSTCSTVRAGRLLAAVGLLAACSGSARFEPPAGTPFVQGPVASITPGHAGIVLLVRAGPESREPCGIAATITARTRVLRRASADGALRSAELRGIRVGDTVEVYVDQVAESCPTQGTPTMLVLR